jgi:undecaprenyl-diphosphatase
MVIVFGSFLKKWRHLWWLWALLVSIAQVYVGVHYPLDIAGGAALGCLVGLSMGTICKHFMKHATH